MEALMAFLQRLTLMPLTALVALLGSVIGHAADRMNEDERSANVMADPIQQCVKRCDPLKGDRPDLYEECIDECVNR